MNIALRNSGIQETDMTPEEFFRSINIPETVPLETAIDQLLGGMIQVTPENMEKIRMLLVFVGSMKPKTMLEAQLILQMTYCHRESAKMFKRSTAALCPETADKYLSMGINLLRTFRLGLESLGKYRRDGKQSFYIERVTVERDAQAIIGNLSKGG